MLPLKTGAVRSLHAVTAPSVEPRAAVRSATIVEPTAAGRSVRVREADGSDAEATLATASAYLPSPGDEVVVAGGPGALFVIGVVHAARPSSLAIPGGGEVRVVGEAVELRDADDRLLVRYTGGSAEIAAPAGDLTLTAPAGRVRVQSGLDVSIEAARDITHHAGRGVDLGAGTADRGGHLHIDSETATLHAPRLSLGGRDLDIESERVTIAARDVAIDAISLKQRVERFDLSADQLVETTVETVREAKEELQLRAGRIRTIVEGAYTQHAKTTTILSAEDTTIDGEHIHLG